MVFKHFLVAMFLFFAPALHPKQTIVESPIFAQVERESKIFRDKTLRQPIGNVAAGDVVEILEDYSAVVYKVAIHDLVGWMGKKNLNIPKEEPKDKSVLTKEELESFVNLQDYDSLTDYLLLTDINRQKTHAFKGEKGNWSLLESFDCSTGLNISPTTRGIFKLSDRGPWFYSHRLASGAKFWIRFNGNYLFHSIPMDKNQNILKDEDMVGEKRSNGCIRLLLPDIKWIYDNIPDGSTVVVI